MDNEIKRAILSKVYGRLGIFSEYLDDYSLELDEGRYMYLMLGLMERLVEVNNGPAPDMPHAPEHLRPKGKE